MKQHKQYKPHFISLEEATLRPVDSTEVDEKPREIGGRKEGLEPTRYGDWEFKGRCIDF